MRADPDPLEPLEAIEQRAWNDMYDAAPADFAAVAGVRRGAVGGFACYAISGAPTVQFNRAQARTAAFDAAGLAPIIDWMTTHGGTAWALQLPSESITTDMARALGSALLTGAGGWSKLVRSTFPPVIRRGGAAYIDTIIADASSADTFGRTIQAGFDAPPAFAAWSAALVGRPRWTPVLALDGEDVVGAASLYVEGSIGWLGMGCTLPTARGRGVQTALIAKRIELARLFGADLVVSETATPDAATRAFPASHHNLRKIGFDVAYERRNFRPVSQLADDHADIVSA